MRKLILIAALLTSGCTSMQELSARHRASRPVPVIMERDDVIFADRIRRKVGSRDLDEFICREGTMICIDWGTRMRCTCETGL